MGIIGLLSSPNALPRMKSLFSDVAAVASRALNAFIREGRFTKASSSSLNMYLGFLWEEKRFEKIKLFC